MNDAYLQEVEILYHFSQQIEQVGSSIASDIQTVINGAYQCRSDFQGAVNTIRDNYAKAEKEYDYARAEYDNALRAYKDERVSWQYVHDCKVSMDLAKEKLERIRTALRRAEELLQQGTQIVYSIISSSQTALQAIPSSASYVSQNVRNAASIISNYVD